MALPSNLFSFASRLLSLRPSYVARVIHSGKLNLRSGLADLEDVPIVKDEELQLLDDFDADFALAHKDFFKVRSLCSPKSLFQAKAHYGHKASSLDPRMKQFVYGIRSNHVIFDLDIANYHFYEALNVTSHISLRGGIVLFVARVPICTHIIEKTAKECGEYAHTREWQNGTLTNLSVYHRMEVRAPDLVILLSTLSEFGTEHPAVVEAAKLNIPSIGIVDSNCNPNLITYPIPGNDDSFSSIELYCSLFKEAILRGKRERAHRLELVKEELAKDKANKAQKINI